MRIRSRLEANQMVVSLVDERTQKAFEFSGDVDLVERMCRDLIEACRLARQKMGLPALILPFDRRTN